MKPVRLIGAICALLALPVLAVTTYGYDVQTVWIEHPQDQGGQSQRFLDNFNPSGGFGSDPAIARTVPYDDMPATYSTIQLERVTVIGHAIGDIKASQIFWIQEPKLPGPSLIIKEDPRDFGIQVQDAPPNPNLSDCKTRCDATQSAANDLCDAAAAKDGDFVERTAMAGGLLTFGAFTFFGKAPGALVGAPAGYAVYAAMQKIGSDNVTSALNTCRGNASTVHHDCLVDVCHVPG